MSSSSIDAYILSEFSSYVPTVSNESSDWSHIANIELTDPQYAFNTPVELILGADVYAVIIQDGLISGFVNTPVAQRTTLGWILTCAL